MLYIGIDPGLKGGIAAIDKDENIVLQETMPAIQSHYDIPEIYSLINELSIQDDSKACLEEVRLMGPLIGKKPLTSLYYCSGLFQMALHANKVGFTIAPAKEWQKELLKGLNRGDKMASIQYVQRKFPGIDLTATERSKKPHDGMADALCLAVYCRRQHLG